jgi:hypothetical protein
VLIRLPLDEWSVKVSDGWPEDPPEDVALSVWAGVLPIRAEFGTPIAAPDLPSGIEPPTYLATWQA